MPLTRHFYSLDEVRSALFYTLSRGNISGALFWCQELLDSSVGSEAISILFETWIFYHGPMNIQWLLDMYPILSSDTVSTDDIQLATYTLSLSNKYKDNSLTHILIMGTQFTDDPPDRITTKLHPVWKSNENTIESFLIHSIYQGKLMNTWWACRYIPYSRINELIDWYCDADINLENNTKMKVCIQYIRGYEKLLGYTSEQWNIIILLLSLLVLHPYKQSFQPLQKQLDRIYLKELEEMEQLIERKKRRMIEIPTECLYGVTHRGCMKWSQTNIKQLYNIEKYLIGCTYWDEELEKYALVNNGSIEWNNDDALEEFYTVHFPDDIPDEWSKKDQMKSHGNGVNGPKDIVNIYKYYRGAFTNKSRYAWGLKKSVLSILQGLVIPSCNITDICDIYLKHNIIQMSHIKNINTDLLKPVKKKFII